MGRIRTIILLLILSISTISQGQPDFKNTIEASFDYGISNESGQGELYGSLFGDFISVENKRSVHTKNFVLSYTRLINSKDGIKATLGRAQYGFDITGVTAIDKLTIRDEYRITYIELGLSYLRKITISPYAKLLIEPGIRFHADGSQTFNIIRIYRIDAFSFSGYAGLEIPMIGSQLFTTIGMQMKIPLERYNSKVDITPAIYPYFIGLKFGVNFQF